MIVKTKKYQLDTSTFKRIGLRHALKDLWWVFAVPLVLVILSLVFWTIWWAVTALVLTGLYLLFWYVMFAGIPKMEQSKMMFEKLSYEVSSQQLIMKLNPKQGMPIQWNQVKSAIVSEKEIILFLSRAQFVHLPKKIFNTEMEIKFVETILKRKSLIK